MHLFRMICVEPEEVMNSFRVVVLSAQGMVNDRPGLYVLSACVEWNICNEIFSSTSYTGSVFWLLQAARYVCNGVVVQRFAKGKVALFTQKQHCQVQAHCI